MRRLAVVLTVAAAGCHGKASPPVPGDARATPGITAVAPGPNPAARFSRPIAAIRASAGPAGLAPASGGPPGGLTLVAGLVVSTASVAVSAIGPDGGTRWTRDAIANVAWSPNAMLNVLLASAGAIVVWRGLRGGKQAAVATVIGLDGTVKGDPFPVGAAACTTDAELAWVDRGPKGAWLVSTRSFATSLTKATLNLPEDREPSLLCGAHTVFAFGDGDDDVTLASPGDPRRVAPLRVIQDADFHGDEERGHEVYAVGDAIGVVRIGLTGSVATREVLDRHASPWRRFGKKLTETDDLTLVDADRTQAIVSFTREAGGDAGGGSSVEAFVWERKGTRDASYQLAPGDVTYERGPFWSGAVQGGIAVAWTLRGVRTDAGQAPVLGMAYRVVSLDALGDVHRVERAADDLVDAGCDDTRCYAVALARAAGEDEGQPEVAAVLAYP